MDGTETADGRGGLELVRHPSSPAGPVRRIDAGVRRVERGAIAVSFVLEGDLDRLRVPPARPARMGMDLWRHTCFELFVGVADAAPYHELNFSPSGEWAAHAFRAYRDGGPLDDESLAPRIVVRRDADRLELGAVVALDALSQPRGVSERQYADAPLRIGLSAVVEESDGTLSYWALRHPPGRPDFHHSDCFALRLQPAR